MPQSNTTVNAPPIFAWSECDPADAPPNEYLVEGLIPRHGSHLILSPPKAGKSQLAAHLVACLISGRPVFGHYAVKIDEELRILWILTEENRFKVRERIEANLRGMGMSEAAISGMAPRFEERVIISARVRDPSRDLADTIFSVEQHAEWLLDVVRSGDFGIVILDSLRPAHGLDENSSTAMQPVTDLLRELSEYGCGNFLHHTGHSYEGSSRVGGDAGRGTSDLDAARDTAIHIRKGTFGGSLLIGFHHRDDAERFVAVRTFADRDAGVLQWEFVSESEDPQAASYLVQSADLLAAIDAAPVPEKLPSKSDAKKYFGDSYREHLFSMEQDGIIEGREFATGRPGANPTLLMRPGQFTDDEWAEAEKRAREAKRA